MQWMHRMTPELLSKIVNNMFIMIKEFYLWYKSYRD